MVNIWTEDEEFRKKVIDAKINNEIQILKDEKKILKIAIDNSRKRFDIFANCRQCKHCENCKKEIFNKSDEKSQPVETSTMPIKDESFESETQDSIPLDELVSAKQSNNLNCSNLTNKAVPTETSTKLNQLPKKVSPRAYKTGNTTPKIRTPAIKENQALQKTNDMNTENILAQPEKLNSMKEIPRAEKESGTKAISSSPMVPNLQRGIHDESSYVSGQ